ncbi:MAG: efflux RND transporter permease subunit [Acidobacteriota bacterium]|nr:efflux RND transporter permease subunit [Acidobacteriota bacterium]MDE3263616.1 efflux RND transporter permease subunit [Acidobacteriota bacterium]
MLNLPLTSIRRPVFALMLNVGLVVLGLVSLNRLNVDLNPDVEFPFVTVTTVLEGASPETVETEVTDVLEEQINTIEGIRDLSSVSSEGISQIFVEFETDYDVDVKAQHVREKIAPVRADLPLDVEDPVVTQLDPDATPILSVMLGGPVSVRELSELAEATVKDRLERLPGVGSIEIIGSRRREVRIWLDPVRLAGYGLSIDDVRSTLLLENAETAGGRVEGREREWTVTTSGKVKRVEDFGALIAAERGGRLVYLRNVAQIEDGLAEERSIARFNGQRGVSLEVRRRSGANTVVVADAVRAEVEALGRDLPPGMEVLITRDMAVFIEDSIYSVFSNMIWGGALVVLVVLLFLRNPRSTLISALAIPSSVIASFTFFYLAGFTLNVMTLMALSLSIGVVIDDAIVVLEVIYRRIERGQERREAAKEGASQVMLAVVSTTLALCAVFMPIAFLSGTVGQFFYEFGMVMTIAVCVSSLFALTLTPMLGSRVLKATQGRDPVSRTLGRGLDALDHSYKIVLRRALGHRALTLAVAVVAMVGGVLVAFTLPFDLFGTEDRSEFNVNLKMPVGTPLAVTSQTARRSEELIAQDPDVRNRFATIGGGSRQEPHRASIYVQLTNKRDRGLSQAAIMDRVRDRLLQEIPEAEEIVVSPISWIAGSEDQTGTRAVSYSLRGPRIADLERYSGRLVARMRTDPSFVDVGTSWETGKPEIEIDVDRDRAADLGVPATVIGRTIRTLLAGEELGAFEEDGERYDVRVQVLPEYRDEPGKLDLIQIRTASGQLTPITNVANIRLGEGAVQIRRQNRSREITIATNGAEGVAQSELAARIEEYGRQIGLAPPNTLVPSGTTVIMQETGLSLLFAFVLAVVAIYMVLASLFNSLVHPVTIMMSAPLSFIGAFLALKLSGQPLDMMSGIGLLVLMGLVMKNGILLIDYINRLRQDGQSRRDAILEAGPARLRPVLMTAFSLIFGLLPVAFSQAAGSEGRAAIAVLIMGGMATSTLLTLLVVPVVYDLVDRSVEKVTAWSRTARDWFVNLGRQPAAQAAHVTRAPRPAPGHRAAPPSDRP